MTGRRRATLIFMLGALTTIGPFSIDMYLPGFSAIARDFRTSIASVGFSLTSYFVGIALGQLVYGPLTDRFGRKRPLVVGLAIYVAAAVACALSRSIGWLVLARFAMALGASVGMVGSRAVVRDVFPVSEIAGVFSTFMLVIAVSPILAPSVGGYLAAGPGWRFIFILLSLLSIALLFMVIFGLRETKAADAAFSLHPLRLFRTYVEIARHPMFAMYGIASGLGLASLFGYISAAPLIFMDRFGMSQRLFGWTFALNASGLIIGSQVNRAVLKRLTPARATTIAVSAQLVVSICLVAVAFTARHSAVALIVLLIGYLFCGGIINPNTAALALEPFSSNAGSAAALLGSLQMGVGALSSALVSALEGANGSDAMIVMAICSAAMFLIVRVANGRILPKLAPDVY